MQPTKAKEQMQICETFDWLEFPKSILLSPGSMDVEQFCTKSTSHCVYMHNVYSFKDILDSSCDILDGLSLFHY